MFCYVRSNGQVAAPLAAHLSLTPGNKTLTASSAQSAIYSRFTAPSSPRREAPEDFQKHPKPVSNLLNPPAVTADRNARPPHNKTSRKAAKKSRSSRVPEETNAGHPIG